jgi:hypothetical protein
MPGSAPRTTSCGATFPTTIPRAPRVSARN